MNRSEQINEIAKALAMAQSEMKPAVKNKKNPFFKSSYADLESVCAACLPILSKHGIAVTQTTAHFESNNISVSLVTTLMHSSGQWFDSIYPVHPTKNDPQSLGSAIKYARRYALSGIACVSEGDDDGEVAMDRDAPESVKESKIDTKKSTAPSEAQLKRLFAIAHKCNWHDEDLKLYLSEKLGIDSTKKLNYMQYDALVTYIQTFPREPLEPDVRGNG